jgi:hypothetical protein
MLTASRRVMARLDRAIRINAILRAMTRSNRVMPIWLQESPVPALRINPRLRASGRESRKYARQDEEPATEPNPAYPTASQ